MPALETTHRAMRIALSLWLLGWICKVGFFTEYLFGISPRFPLRLDFFPGGLCENWTSAAAYLAPIAVAAWAYLSPRPAVWRYASAVMTVSAAVLCLHLNTYNDVTFVTSFWAGLWICWLAWQHAASAETLAVHGPVLAQGVISLTFLGGALGKLTPEYWSGEALYHLYILQKENFLYPWLRETFDPSALRAMAAWLSRGAIVVELAVACGIAYPCRRTLRLSAWVMAGIVLVSTWYLFSVMGALIGVALAAVELSKAAENRSSPNHRPAVHPARSIGLTQDQAAN